jgi:hypothetical protein
MLWAHQLKECRLEFGVGNEAAQRMRQKFDTPLGREIYCRRMRTVEPVFGNIRLTATTSFLVQNPQNGPDCSSSIGKLDNGGKRGLRSSRDWVFLRPR